MCHSAEGSSLVKLFQFAFNSLPAHHCCVQNDIAIAVSPKSRIKLFVSYTTSFFTITTDERKSSEVFDFMNKGSVWDTTTEVQPQIPASRSHLRYLATYRETSLIALLSALTARQDAQKARALQRERPRTGSISRYNGIQRASRTTCGGSVPAAGPSDDAGNSNPPIPSQCSSIRQGSTSGASIGLS